VIFLHSIGFGLVTASILALCSVGLTLQFGVTNYINFAIGAYLTIGAYFAWVVNTIGMNIWLAMIIGGVLTGVMAVLLNLGIMQNFVRRDFPVLFMLIVMFGLSLILQNVTLAIWGADFKNFTSPPDHEFSIGPFLLTGQQLLIIGIAVVAMVGVHVLLTYTKVGKAMRAMSDNPTLARNCGIDTDLVTNFTWFISGFLAGIAGVVLALNITSFQPSFGSDFEFVIFAAIIVGGIGRPYGAMAGALIIGLVTEVSAAFIDSSYKNDMAFAILVLVLLLRPQGIFATEGKA
jgi:branched-subunit amino acid ABC-type transport system permease component